MKTRSQILDLLRETCPTIAISIHWDEDDSSDLEIFHNGNALEGEDPADWMCWQSEVRASVIANGLLVSGFGYLSGTWEKAENEPDETNPEISGYFPQMCLEALQDLKRQVSCPVAAEAIARALAHFDY